MGSAPSAATGSGTGTGTVAPSDTASLKKDAATAATDSVRPIAPRKDTANRSSHSSNRDSNSKQSPITQQQQNMQKHTVAASSSVATAAAAAPAFVKRSSSFSANSSNGHGHAPLVLPPITGAATPSSLSRQIIQQPQPPLVPPGHVPSPVSRNRGGMQRVPSTSSLGRHSPGSQQAQAQPFPTAMHGHVTPSPRGTIHITHSGSATHSAEKPSPPHTHKHPSAIAALQPTQRTSPSSSVSVHAPNSTSAASSSTGRRSSRGEPHQPNSASHSSHSTTLVQPFQSISPPVQHHARRLSSQQPHSYSHSPTPMQQQQQHHPLPPQQQPVPPAIAAAPPAGTASARGRKTLAVHTQLDPPHPALATFAPTHLPPPALPPAQPVVSHPSQQPVWFDTSAADEYLAAYGPSSPQSSRSPVLDMRDLEGVASWELPLPHNIVSENHLMLQPFGVQQTHAMQVEEDMEYIMDRPIPAVDLEQPVVAKQLTPVAKTEVAPPTARRLRKHLSTGGGLITTHMQAPPPIQTTSAAAVAAAHHPHYHPQLQQLHHIPTSGGGSATHSANSHSSFPRQTSASAVSTSTVEGVDRPLSHQTLSSLSASPASTDASAYGSAPPTLRPNSLQLTSPGSASAASDGGASSSASSSSLQSVGSPSTASGLSSSFASSGGSVTSRSAAAAATLALVSNMPIDVALPIVQAAMYDESNEEYQEYKAKWIAEKEAATKEAARAAAVDRAVAHGLLPPSHGRKSSRSMFGDSAGSPASGGSRALSPALLVYSPIQPSSPLLMHRGGPHHIPSHSGYASPMRSLSPLGSPHSPTIFATLLESNSRNASRNISPQPSSPMSRDRGMSPHGFGPGGGGGGGAGGGGFSAAVPKGFTHRHHASVINVPPPPSSSHDGLAGSHSGDSTARSISGGGGQPPRHGHSESLLCNTYDNLRLGWIPSDLSVSGAIPVPYK